MARYDDLKTGPIAYAAFISSILLLVIILLVRALCYGWVEAEDTRKLAEAHYVAADNAIAEQKRRISKEGKEMVTIPPPAGDENKDAKPTQEERLHIPIDVAKEIILKSLAKEPKAE